MKKKTIFSFTHIEGIILGADEDKEVDDYAGGASDIGVDRASEVGERSSDG
jgi:hypothetical protein